MAVVVIGAGIVGLACAFHLVRDGHAVTVVDRDPEIVGRPAIRPSVAGRARLTGQSTIFIDDRDPLADGFQLR